MFCLRLLQICASYQDRSELFISSQHHPTMSFSADPLLSTPSDHVFLSWPTPLNTIRPCLSQLTHSLIHWQFACDLIFKWISWLQCLDTVLSIWPATNLLQRSVRDLAYFMVSLPETWPKSRWVSLRETWPISWWVSQRPDLNHSESPRDLA